MARIAELVCFQAHVDHDLRNLRPGSIGEVVEYGAVEELTLPDGTLMLFRMNKGGWPKIVVAGWKVGERYYKKGDVEAVKVRTLEDNECGPVRALLAHSFLDPIVFWD